MTIQVQHLSKYYNGHRAVDSISFDVPQGSNFMLIGRSGCGKTTTLKMINRLIEPSSGRIRIRGQEITQLDGPQLRRNIGYVIQTVGLFPHLNVYENIATVPRLLQWKKAKIDERIHFLLRQLHLSENNILLKRPHELSGGQQQRVGMARALAAEPDILLMDEPFGALDPITKVKIRREFMELEEIKDKTVVMVTHDVDEAFELGDRIGIMEQGQLQQTGTPKEVLMQPSNTFVRDFFQEKRFQLFLKIYTWEDLAIENTQLDIRPQTPLAALMEHTDHQPALDWQQVMQAIQTKFNRESTS
ncbi:ATP-binding cassette domain-containing protein [Rapidithrix thailandica]|uniref:ATP-binding cassette domain-containing protein n=1 Tax=Rapidithrix thailandica TaxID=413964 RepID=A0AAW9SDH4_9BACT